MKNINKTLKITTLISLLSFSLGMSATQAANGDYDSNTSNGSTCIYLTYDLKYKSLDKYTNDEVSKVQSFLQERGYLNAEPSGYFGLMTQNAIKSYQTNKGLVSTGYVGTYTRQMIQTDSCYGYNNNSNNNYNISVSTLMLDPINVSSTIYSYKNSSNVNSQSSYLSSLRFKTNFEFNSLKRFNLSLVNTNLNTSAITFVNNSCIDYTQAACYNSYNSNVYGNAEYYGYIDIDLRNSNLINGNNYYFTLRVTDPTSNSNYKDFTYNFTYSTLGNTYYPYGQSNTQTYSQNLTSTVYPYGYNNYANTNNYTNGNYSTQSYLNYIPNTYNTNTYNGSGLGAFIGTTAGY